MLGIHAAASGCTRHADQQQYQRGHGGRDDGGTGVRQGLDTSSVLGCAVLGTSGVGFTSIGAFVGTIVGVVPGVPVVAGVPASQTLLRVGDGRNGTVRGINGGRLVGDRLLRVGDGGVERIDVGLGVAVQRHALGGINGAAQAGQRVEVVELGDVGVTIIGHGTAEVVGGVQIVTCNGVTARNDLAVVVSRACPSSMYSRAVG